MVWPRLIFVTPSLTGNVEDLTGLSDLTGKMRSLRSGKQNIWQRKYSLLCHKHERGGLYANGLSTTENTTESTNGGFRIFFTKSNA